MDPLPQGPRRVAPKNQITVPAELLDAIGVVVGGEVFVVSNPDRPGTLVIIPRAMMEEIFRKGWTALS